VLKTFEVRLSSSIHVGSEASRTLKISGQTREKEFNLVSIGDIDVQSDLDSDQLVISKQKL
jgi:hypothetical protein